MNIFLQRIHVLGLILLGWLCVGCHQTESTYTKIEPAVVEHIEHSELSTLTLTEKAVQRTGIKTETVGEQSVSDKSVKTIAYAAVLYGPQGRTWVYKNPKPLVYVRHEIKVDRIDGDVAYLLEGPPVGTVVVTQGVSELYGTEYHVGH